MPHGIIHGDANIGNVLHDFHGNPVVIDLDDVCTGPREWDRILTAIYTDHFGWHTQEQYDSFARIYGYDITHWRGYPTLATIREFLMITWVIQKTGESKKTAVEARKRLNALRTGSSRKDWSPF